MKPDPFIAVLKHAQANKWCVEPGCTTCGATEFRKALHKVAGDVGGPLANSLSDIDLNELQACQHWADATEIALRDLPLGVPQIEGVLKAWLPQTHQHIRILDRVLFKIVRYLPATSSIRADWIRVSEEVALATKDFSLVESLVLVIGDRAVEHLELIGLAQQIAQESPQMRRVIHNTCGAG
jgi:hypothetical protein